MSNSIGNIILPEDWNIVQISDLSGRITKGTTPSSYGFEYTNSGVNYIKVESITDSGKFKKDMFAKISQEAHEKLSRSQFEEGDLLITIAGNLGRTAIVTKDILPANTNQAVAIVKLNKECLSAEYVKFFLQGFSIKQYIQMVSTVGAQPNLSLKQIGEMAVALPAFKEQSKIAAILTSIDEAIEKTEAIIEQTEKVKKGLMQKLLTKGIGHTEFKQAKMGQIPMEWNNKTIGELVKFEGGAQPPRDNFIFEPREGYIRLIQIRDYKTDKYKTFVPRGLARKFCNEDDIMIGRYGPPIFQILRGIKGAYNVALIKAIPSEEVTKDYLYYFLNQEPLFRMIEHLSQRTSGQTGIDMTALKSYPFPLPSIEEQKKITDVLDTWQQKINKEYEILEQKKVLKKGLMQDLLTGKVRVQVDQPEVITS